MTIEDTAEKDKEPEKEKEPENVDARGEEVDSEETEDDEDVIGMEKSKMKNPK